MVVGFRRLPPGAVCAACIIIAAGKTGEGGNDSGQGGQNQGWMGGWMGGMGGT